MVKIEELKEQIAETTKFIASKEKTINEISRACETEIKRVTNLMNFIGGTEDGTK